MTLEEIRERQKAGYKIGIYCCGQIGQALYQMLQICGIQTNCFLDNNREKNNYIVSDGVICKNPNAIMDKDEYIIFIAILDRFYDTINETAIRQGFKYIEDYSCLFDDIVRNYAELYKKIMYWFSKYPLLEMFYVKKPNHNEDAVMAPKLDLRQNRVAVYTAVFGDYDVLNLTRCSSVNADYYIVSDKCPDDLNGYKWMNAKNYIPVEITSPIKRNRYVKMHPHKLFPEYQYSVYIDGNIEICGDITECIRDNEVGIAAYIHPRRDCIFYEATTIVNYKRVDVTDAYEQIFRYLMEGMPLHYGLFEMGVLGRAHQRRVCKKLMEEWWQEFNKGALRDQLSFMYVLWKNELGIKDIASLGEDIRASQIVRLRNHISDSCLIRNV